MPPIESSLGHGAAIVVTTVNHPTAALRQLAGGCRARGCDLVIVGDEASPAGFTLEGGRYFDLAAQRRSGSKYAQACPTRHYARKNVGYLQAIAAGARVIVETDDDNAPLAAFWAPRARQVVAKRIGGAGWVNAYAFFTRARIWPRGLPLSEVQSRAACSGDWPTAETDCPIQQGLANGNPDVDAIYRLTRTLPFDFDAGAPVALGPGAWCPFNSQNTTFFRAAFPLLYLPYYCSFRMTDIWRGFVAQVILHANGWSVMFHGPTVFQERNQHDLMRDFRDEVPGYLNNATVMSELSGLSLPAGMDHLPGNLARCYARLVEIKLLDARELPLLEMWLEDLQQVMAA